MGAHLTRRGLFVGGAAAVGSAAIGTAAGCASSSPPATPVDAKTVPFSGAHQAGITTPAQDRLHFVALDMSSTSRDDLIDLLQSWTRQRAGSGPSR